VDAHDVIALIERNGDAKRPTHARRRRNDEDRELLARLQRCAGDVNEVASELGIHRATVYRRLDRLGVVAPFALERPEALT
jgi:transcriptional regulator of acetoin/glycerol metabolism